MSTAGQINEFTGYTGGPANCSVSSPVPSDPRERRVVGRGLHRVDERRRGAAPVSRATTSRTCPPTSGFYDLRRARDARGCRRSWLASLRDPRLLLLPLLVRRASACSNGRSTRCWRPGEPDFPFCLCWANENWTRTWDGGDHELLMSPGAYSARTMSAHIEHLLPVFQDSRYIKINGSPLFLIYRSEMLPDSAKTAELWRRAAQKAGFPDLFLVRVESFRARSIRQRSGSMLRWSSRRTRV